MSGRRRLSSLFTLLLVLVNVYLCVLLCIDSGRTPSANISTSRNLKYSDGALFELNSNVVYTLPIQGPPATRDVDANKHKHQKFLVIMVLSSPKGKERRDGVRQTWMKGYRDRTPKVCIIFSIGTQGLSSQDVRALISENSTHGDLLLLPHLHDSYNNLTRKVLESFVAINNFYNFTYLMKCDDDSFVVLDTILKELSARKSKRNYYWGFIYSQSVVRQQGKWAEEKWFLCDTYFPYAAGGGYVVSQTLVGHLSANRDSFILYNNEDVSMGAWLSPYDAERQHDTRFKARATNLDCEKDIVIHYQTVEDMKDRQKLLNETGRIC